MKVGDLARIDSDHMIVEHFFGKVGIVVDVDQDQGSVYLLLDDVIEEFHATYCRTVS